MKKKDERAKSAKKKQKVKEIRLKELKWFKCARCGAFKLNTESKGFCRGNEKEHLVKLPDVPPILLDIIREERALQTRIRACNNFGAVGTTGSEGFRYHDNYSNLIIHGRTYHWMPSGSYITDM